jgi:hypothetical protein
MLGPSHVQRTESRIKIWLFGARQGVDRMRNKVVFIVRSLEAANWDIAVGEAAESVGSYFALTLHTQENGGIRDKDSSIGLKQRKV